MGGGKPLFQRVISEREFQRRIDALVERALHPHKGGHPSDLPATSQLRRIYEAIARLGVASYAEIFAALGVDRKGIEALNYAGRIRYLIAHDWVIDAGARTIAQVDSRGRTIRRHVRQFAVGPGSSSSLQGRMDRLVAAVERLERKRSHTKGIAATAERSQRWGRLAARNRSIIEARGRGETLKQIGARWGLTRERVRQIIDATQPVHKEDA